MADCVEGNAALDDHSVESPLIRPKRMKDLKNLKVRELRKLCKDLSLESTGTGVVLRDRIAAELRLNTAGEDHANEDGSSSMKVTLFRDSDTKAAYQNIGPLNRMKAKWSKDCRSLPYFDLVRLKRYLIHSADKSFDNESVKAYKTLRAYSLFEEGHLDNLEYFSEENSYFCFLRCDCLPSQGTTETYKVVICLDKTTGEVYGAHCVCVAGLGEVCSHTAALLFCLEAIIAGGVKNLPNAKACTEKLCAWLAPKGRKVAPVPLSEINVYKPEYGKPAKLKSVGASSDNFDPRAPEHRTVYREDIAKLQSLLKESNPQCPFMENLELERFPSKYCEKELTAQSNSDTLLIESRNIVEAPNVCNVSRPVPQTISEAIENAQQILYQSINKEDVISDQNAKLSESFHQSKFTEYVERQTCTSEFVKDVEFSTRGQSNNPLWFYHRVGRITASNFSSVNTRRRTTPPDNLVKTVMSYSNAQAKASIPALVHGKITEAKACEAYIHYMQDKGTPVQVQECGLYISRDNPWCGASPDGTVYDPHAQDPHGLLEVKCPYTENFVEVEKLIDERKKFYLVKEGKCLQINPKHGYYAQVQGQMGVTGRKWTDFVVYIGSDNESDIVVTRVSFNKPFWESLKLKISSFYSRFIVAEIFSRRVLHKAPLYPEIYMIGQSFANRQI